ncbi:MAG: hypothetical protein QF898_07800 [SAR202 cluster bacterium]|nr:hypothetical protein [SAR202 cluster bacterium]MDP6513867.1 hypothetical protein [SAR202 cluster bacterium]MDP6715184.1 hypothetical protein [SAR202 cluster bacterium]
MPVEIGDRDRQQWTEVSALVDAGASISSLPASLLHELEVPILSEQQQVVTLVLFNDEGTPPLLGAMALEGLFMGIDPHARRLIPVEGLLMSSSMAA